MNRIQLFGFLKHRLTAKTRHGVHSPFVYRLVEEAVYGANPAHVKAVLKFFALLKSSSEVVQGLDYGKSMSEQQHYSIGAMARKSSIADYQVQLLARLANHHEATNMLELGTNLGKTSALLAKVRSAGKVTTVEGNAALATEARQHHAQLGIQNSEVVVSSFDDYLVSSTELFDFIFVDGDHHYDATLRYFHALRSRLKGEGPIILHDIYWSEGMQLAWKEICAMHDVTVTVDLYSMGLVYFRPKQQKEHFAIRFPRLLSGFF